MPAKYFKTHGHLLVCQGRNCVERGADLLYAGLRGALERDRLAYYKTGGSVRLTPSGCLGACSYGPTIACYRQREGTLEEAWYAGMDVGQALRLAQAVHEQTALPGEGRYGPPALMEAALMEEVPKEH